MRKEIRARSRLGRSVSPRREEFVNGENQFAVGVEAKERHGSFRFAGGIGGEARCAQAGAAYAQLDAVLSSTVVRDRLHNVGRPQGDGPCRPDVFCYAVKGDHCGRQGVGVALGAEA